MTDQAIYNAVRSKITNGNIGEAVERAIRDADIGHHYRLVQDDIAFHVSRIAEQWQRPSVLYRPDLSLDGDHYCALYGSNIMDGCAGFGKTAEAAMADFDERWKHNKAPIPHDREEQQVGEFEDGNHE